MTETNKSSIIDEECLEIDNSWIRVGTVMSIHVQPLLSGKTIVTKDYICKSIGLIALQDDSTIIRKNTLVVYDTRSYCIQQKELNSALQNLEVVNLNNFDIRLMAPEMNDLIVYMLRLIEHPKHIMCKASFCEKYLVEMKCIDCGEEAATWISKYLQKPHLRLAYATSEPQSECQFWYRMKKLYQSELDERDIMMPYNSIPRYTLLSHRSLTELNETSERHFTLEHFNPDICIMPQSAIPFVEFDWEWILIGNAIMKNIKPWNRLKIDPMQMPIDMKINMMLLHCELQQSGSVQIGDNVYVRRTST